VIQTMRQALRRWLVALIAVTVLAAGGAAAYSLLSPPRYAATTQLLVGPINADAESIKASSQLIGTYASLVVSPAALGQAATAVGGGRSASEIEKATSVQFSSATRLLDVTVTLDSPEAAVTAVRTLGDILKRSTSQNVGAGSLTSVVEPTANNEPVATNPVLRGSIAGVTAFIIALLLVLLLEQTRGVIRTSTDVETATGRDALVEFPRRRKGTGPVRHGDAPTTAAYRMLAAYLDTLEPRPGAHCVAVVGTGPDGRSQMPLNLAIALATTGRRALLLENETERPRSLAVFDTAPIDITGQAALYLFTPDPMGADFKVERLGLSPETYQLALAWAESRSRAATAQAVEAVGGITDWVVLAPRSIEASDVGLSWAAAADAVLLVVEQGITRRRELQSALVTLRRLTNQPIEVVLVPEGVREGRSTKQTLKAIQDDARLAAAKREAKMAAKRAEAGLPPAPPAGQQPGQQQPGQQQPRPQQPVPQSAPPAGQPMFPVVQAPQQPQPVQQAAPGHQPGHQPGQQPPQQGDGGSWTVTDTPRYRTAQPVANPAAAPAGYPAANPAAHPAANPAVQQGAGHGRPGDPRPIVLPDAGQGGSVVPPDSIFSAINEAPAASEMPAAPAPADRAPWTGTFVPPPVVAPDQNNGRPRNGTPGRSR